METVEFGGVSCMWCIDLGMDASDVLFNGPVRCIVGYKKRSNSRYYWQASSRIIVPLHTTSVVDFHPELALHSLAIHEYLENPEKWKHGTLFIANQTIERSLKRELNSVQAQPQGLRSPYLASAGKSNGTRAGQCNTGELAGFPIDAIIQQSFWVRWLRVFAGGLLGWWWLRELLLFWRLKIQRRHFLQRETRISPRSMQTRIHSAVRGLYRCKCTGQCTIHTSMYMYSTCTLLPGPPGSNDFSPGQPAASSGGRYWLGPATVLAAARPEVSTSRHPLTPDVTPKSPLPPPL
ncbi:conserved hypothetical protein [Histoplasma capsulatum var. duboisii H88]|uniref:Uncharacterized protein n=1 Tax=Ajellomyces capsulatus (strain H88) TaxID=544711 RepID=F0UG19_AJEC8|nr:conserved hypothetical protein [Histoplasma capsulatum var. duboisii H88]